MTEDDIAMSRRLAERELTRAVEQRNRLSNISDSELVCAGLRCRADAEERLDGLVRVAWERLWALSEVFVDE